MASKKHWKKRAKRAERLRGAEQARHFERESKFAAQLRAIDHILEGAELSGPTPEEWMQQARELLFRIGACRRERREDGYTVSDIEKMRSFPYVEHFAPSESDYNE